MIVLKHFLAIIIIGIISLIGIKKTSYEEYFVALMVINIVYLIIVIFYMIYSTINT